MSAPAYTSRPERPAGELLLEMFDRGIRHFPVVSATGTVLGVIEAADLLVARTRSSFYLRQRIREASSVSELAVVAGELRPMVIALHEARVGSGNVMAVYSIAVDALIRRLLELALARRPGLHVEFAWLALGSQARREALPSSDVDSAIVWFGEVDEAEIKPRLLELGREVVAGLERCGIRADEHGASAAADIFVRSLASFRRAIQSWIANPHQEKALILTSVLVDSRPVFGVHTGSQVADTFRLAPSSPALLRLLARFALSHRPPTGFFRGLVVAPSGEHRGQLDLKLGGVVPIADLARWAAMAAGVTAASTTERLRAAGAAGVLGHEDARTLEDAFRLINDLRAGHQVDQLRAGVEPDDHLDPRALSPLMRTQLREAFRAVTSAQRRLAGELEMGVR
jgi:CBS domain-containing protein